MGKSIDTLVSDIHGLFEEGNGWQPKEENIKAFGESLARHLAARASLDRGHPTLRLSNIGTKCQRKLWYSINQPEKAEPLSPAARFKFLVGDMLEELLLFLAAEAGHTIEGQQDELEINGVKGHRDCIIDGRLVDVKSASTFSFKKFATNGLREEDPFGYIPQIESYVQASKGDERLKESDVASFLVVDKTLGHICLDTYQVSDHDYSKQVDELREMLAQPEPPPREFEDVPEGKSGNKKLCTQCSYCDFKNECWPGLRVFTYSKGPVFLTEVAKEPKVLEAVDF